MADLWRWRSKPVTPPAERVDEQRRIAELDVMVLVAAEVGDWPRVDRLLDMRNAIRPPRVALRPSVPVIPGRSS